MLLELIIQSHQEGVGTMVIRGLWSTEVPPEAVREGMLFFSIQWNLLFEPSRSPADMGAWECNLQGSVPCDKMHNSDGQARPLGANILTGTRLCPLENRGADGTFLALLGKLRSLTCILAQRRYLANLFCFVLFFHD